MCGDSHLPPAPESSDLIAIIYPVPHSQILATSPKMPTLTRTSSNSSTTSTSSTTSSNSPWSIQGRLRLSNRHKTGTTSEFSHDDAGSEALYGLLNVRIHKYGSPLQFDHGNPVMHEFCIDQSRRSESSVRLDLGVGGEGLVGRTVSIVDCEERILGEGIIGRI